MGLYMSNIIVLSGWIYRTVVRALALLDADLGSVPGITYDPLCPAGVNPECRTKIKT